MASGRSARLPNCIDGWPDEIASTQVQRPSAPVISGKSRQRRRAWLRDQPGAGKKADPTSAPNVQVWAPYLLMTIGPMSEQIGRYCRLSSVAQRELRCVMIERWLLLPSSPITRVDCACFRAGTAHAGQPDLDAAAGSARG